MKGLHRQHGRLGKKSWKPGFSIALYGSPGYCRISRQTIADRIRIDALCYHSAVRRTGFEQRLNLGLIAGIKLEWFGPLQHLRPQTTQWVF